MHDFHSSLPGKTLPFEPLLQPVAPFGSQSKERYLGLKAPEPQNLSAKCVGRTTDHCQVGLKIFNLLRGLAAQLTRTDLRS